jgi:hypothetical protein
MEGCMPKKYGYMKVPVLSVSMNKSATAKFFKRLRTNDYFGISARFKPEDAISIARENGVIARPVTKRSKLGQLYGEYVLRVKEVDVSSLDSQARKNLDTKLDEVMHLLKSFHATVSNKNIPVPDIKVEINFVPHGYEVDYKVDGRSVGGGCRDFGGSYDVAVLKSEFTKAVAQLVEDFEKKVFTNIKGK